LLSASLAYAPQGNPAPVAPPACAADRYDGTGQVGAVFDGDTLALGDGTKVRLGGIDTPETGRDGEPSEAFAEAAYRHLLQMAAPGERVKLRFDLERRDRYGRVLAHVFLADGSNVQASLLRRGLATTLVVPPNEWSHACYARIEARARAARRGIWSLARYQAVPAEALDAEARGFRIVTGVIRRIGESRHNLWLNLSPDFALRIPRGDLDNFRDVDLHRLRGRRVEARGWIHERRQQLRMTIRHPAALHLTE